MSTPKLELLPSPDLDIERCDRHGTEYPIWLSCPRCSEENECAAFASHFARKRREGENLPMLFDCSEWESEAERGARQSATRWLSAFVVGGVALILWLLGYYFGYWSY